ncbi:hypothetical protein ASPWEDRAFT_179794 [Aspergillus wentii DTO 134E9]|uniref:Uncharacterized protein n=1 Tax=Aspergillus wentii DTO 134E9 TaxID=1073089 RepID=A0A1L9RTB9_ASPWE|nr:uncharacterized protein ASPWEDRAFT_179794 [Aspergillus wentii DTO 134E9]KAI9933857.1 hypothetical protein MW887_004929 [Aspergillus wentii]OJJ38206.1 hypothetical protein ASPWEDRAFT_179794 [Aspergillus wentii DTO 134E9]
MPTDPSNPASSHSEKGNRHSFSSQGSNESHHSEDKSQKASIFDFLSKGPQISNNMPPKVPREELEARKKQLNK